MTSRPINLHQLTIALLILLGVLVHRNQCAPAVEEEDVEGGCYYMFNHYGEGDRILTNEPCLNCTCHNSMLMCYLRVCPFTKPIGQDCTIEKKPDQCCPVITCPQVPVSLVTPTALMTTTSTTTVSTVGSSSEVAILDRGCEMDGKYYPDGAQVASDVNKPCELCYCIRNRTACVMQECILHVEGCSPIFESGVCCPVRYTCDGPLEIETTTPGLGNLISTTISNIFGGVSSTPQPGGCIRDGEYYTDGSQIPSPDEDPCNHCYCMRGDVVCAVQECGSPMENEGGNCTAVKPRAGLCCPEKYTCESTDSPLDDEPISAQTTTEHVSSLVTESKVTISSLVSSSTQASSTVEDEDQGTTVSVGKIPGVQSDDVDKSTSLSSENLVSSSTNSPDSLATVAAEATTVHVKVISTDGEQVDGTTFTPVSQDVNDDLNGDKPSDETTHASSSSSTTESQKVEVDTTSKPQDDEKIETTLSSMTIEQSSTSSPAPENIIKDETVSGSTTSSTTPGSAEEMILTTTPESEDDHQDSHDETEAVQPTTVSSSILESSVSTSPSGSSTVPSSISDIIASTTSRVNDDVDDMEDTATTLNPEIKVTGSAQSSTVGVSQEPATTSSSQDKEQSTDSVSHDKPTDEEEAIIHMTTQKPEVGETEAPKQDEPVTSPKVESASSASPDVTEAPATDLLVTTIENLVSSSTTEKQELAQNDDKVEATTLPADSGSKPLDDQNSPHETGSPVETTVASVSSSTSAPKVTEGETTVIPSVVSPSDENPTSSSDDIQDTTSPSVPVKVEENSSSSSTETVIGTTVSEESGSSMMESSERPEVPSSSTSESIELNEPQETTQSVTVEQSQSHGVVSEGAASSVATERIPTTTNAGVSSDEEAKPEATTLSPVTHESIVQSSTVAPQEGQTTVNNAVIEEKIQENNKTKPVFVVATTEGHMIIIPPQDSNTEKIPVMPLQRENETSSVTPSSTTKVPESSEVPITTFHPVSHAPQEDDHENDIHDELPHDTTHEEKSTTEKFVPTIPSSTEKPTERVPEVNEDEPATTLPSATLLPEQSSSVSPVGQPQSSTESAPTTILPGEPSEGVTSHPVNDDLSVASSEATTLKQADEVPEITTTPGALEPIVVSDKAVTSIETVEATTVESEEPATLPAQISTSASPSSSTSKPLSDETETSASTTAEEVTAPSSTEGTTSKSVEVSSESQSTSENSIEGSTPSSSSTSVAVDSKDSSSSSSGEPEEIGSTTPRLTADLSDDVQESSTSSGEEKDSSSTTTEAEDTSSESTPGAVRVPGEGSCFVEGITYQNGSRIPPSTSCQLACACQNSIVHCLLVHCPPSPSDLGDCKPVYERGICCPTYECGVHSSTKPPVTVTPEPHDKEDATPSRVTVVSELVSSSTVAPDEKIDANAPVENDKNDDAGQTTHPTLFEEHSQPPVAPAQNQVTESTSTTLAVDAGPDESHSHGDVLGDDHQHDKPENAPPETVTVQPESSSQQPPEMSNLDSTGVQEGVHQSQTTDEILGTTPESVFTSSTVLPSTNIHTQTEITAQMVSSSSSSSSTSSVVSSSSPVENATVEENQSSSQSPVTNFPVADDKVDVSTSTSSPVEVSTSSSSTVENEVYDEAVNGSTVESAGSKYPVTTTTSVTPSPAPWPYPSSSSSTASPAMSSGACLFDGRVYMSAQQIPRDDPCDFCFCFRGDIICLQQSCPPPIPGCYEEPIPGFCCPRYECPVGSGNTTTSPPLFPPSYYHSQILNNAGQPSSSGGSVAPPVNNIATGPGCEIQGEYYETGQVILSTSGPCLECRCGSQGMMECDPRECQPEPMLRKMIAAITSR